MEELKPCKLCNEEKDLAIIREDIQCAYVKCMKCGYKGPDAKNEQQAIDAWNKKS